MHSNESACIKVDVLFWTKCKMRTKMQVDTFILLLLCFLFGVYAMRFIYMVIVKEIVFSCVTYGLTLYGTDQKQLLAIKMDHYSLYGN